MKAIRVPSGDQTGLEPAGAYCLAVPPRAGMIQFPPILFE
jgi:hypothetical protein